MKKIYWMATLAGAALTPYAREVATRNRGYIATGGEVLIAPLFLLIMLLINQLYEMCKAIK